MKATPLVINRPSLLFGLNLLLVLAIVLSVPAAARADNFEPWSSAASTGTVDEADTGIVVFSGATASVAGTAALPATLDIRYNIVPVDGLLQGLDGTFFEARFRDNGPNARVVLRLKGINKNTGVISTVFTIDSNTFAAAAGFQNQSTPGCGVGLNFNENTYFIEAQLSKSAAGGNPGLQILRAGNILC